MNNNENDDKPYYVVQFIEKPFEGIDDYVCVPYPWLIIRTGNKQVAVAYPDYENPTFTKDFVKRKEGYDEKWKFYIAEIKYESKTYQDAIIWIAKQKDYERVADENSDIKVTPPGPEMTKEQLDEKLLTDITTSPALNSFNMGTEFSIREPSIVIKDSDKIGAAAITSNYEPTSSQPPGENHRPTSVPQAETQHARNMPVINTDETIAFISIGEEGELQRSESNTHRQTQPASNTTNKPMVPSQPSTSVRPSQFDHPNHQEHSQESENSQSICRPISSDVLSLKAADDDQRLRSNGISNNEQYASHDLPSTSLRTAPLYSQINDRMTLIPLHEPNKKTTRLMNPVRLMTNNNKKQITSSPSERHLTTVNQHKSQRGLKLKTKNDKSYNLTFPYTKQVLERVNRDAFASQNKPSLLPQQRPRFVRRSKQRHSPAQEQCQQQAMDVQADLQTPIRLHSVAQRSSFEKVVTNKASILQRLLNLAANQPKSGVTHSYQNNLGNFQRKERQELRRKSKEENNSAQPSKTDIKTSIPTLNLISSNIEHQTTLGLDFIQQKQPALNHGDTQLRPRASEAEVSFPIEAKNNINLNTAQGVSKVSSPLASNSLRQELINTQRDFKHLQLLEEARKGNTISNITGLKAASENVAPAVTTGICNLKIPEYLSPISLRIPLRLNNVPQQQLIHQPSETMTKQVNSQVNIVNSSAVRSPPRAAGDVRVIDNSKGVDAALPNENVVSDCDVAGDEHIIPEPLRMTDAVNLEKTIDTDCTGISGPHSSTSTNDLLHSKLVLEQDILNLSSSLYNEIGSTLNYMCNVLLKNLRSSILETVDGFKKLADVEEKLNMVPRMQPDLTEERQSRVTDREGSCRYRQHSNLDVNLSPRLKRKSKLCRVVLPKEYNPNDTRWTLKYQKLVPELAELWPGSGVYVNSIKLMYAERVSGDCKTLAQLVLEEVFSETALIVCLSFLESSQSAKDHPIDRPPLDAPACKVLFNYVSRYGNLHDWKVKTEEIIKAIDIRIHQLREKHDVFAESYEV